MPQITLLKKTFQEQGNGIHKFMSDNHDGNQDQKIPDFSKRINKEEKTWKI